MDQKSKWKIKWRKSAVQTINLMQTSDLVLTSDLMDQRT